MPLRLPGRPAATGASAAAPTRDAAQARRKRIVRHTGTTLAAIGVIAFVYLVVRNLPVDQLRAHLDARAILALIVAAVLYGATVPISAFAWQRLLAGMDVQIGYQRLLAILMATQIGKYLPGNVGQIVGRAALSLKEGLAAGVLAASMAYEILLLVLTGVAVGCLSAALSQPGVDLLVSQRGAILVGAVAVSLAGLAIVPLIGKLLPWLVRRLARSADGERASAVAMPRAAALATALLAYGCAYLAIGASASVLASVLFPGQHPDAALLTASFAIAWVVGFVTPGAPAGVGVRETLLMLMLAPSMGTAQASLLVLALRIATTAGDILCFTVGLALMRQLRRSRITDNHGTPP